MENKGSTVGLVLIRAAAGWWDREGQHTMLACVCVGDFL